ncbi:hypothetical protein F4808DRAFT_467286 [Astrocystis sublimbata]|nr:hypothetical protein F4808DRAFT_467284 [Astrocystis sublimbata]KAI0189480.1 hypothetical protein F4808DRAFT_467286 [Astrocystis sublimbata]
MGDIVMHDREDGSSSEDSFVMEFQLICCLSDSPPDITSSSQDASALSLCASIRNRDIPCVILQESSIEEVLKEERLSWSIDKGHQDPRCWLRLISPDFKYNEGPEWVRKMFHLFSAIKEAKRIPFGSWGMRLMENDPWLSIIGQLDLTDTDKWLLLQTQNDHRVAYRHMEPGDEGYDHMHRHGLKYLINLSTNGARSKLVPYLDLADTTEAIPKFRKAEVHRKIESAREIRPREIRPREIEWQSAIGMFLANHSKEVRNMASESADFAKQPRLKFMVELNFDVKKGQGLQYKLSRFITMNHTIMPSDELLAHVIAGPSQTLYQAGLHTYTRIRPGQELPDNWAERWAFTGRDTPGVQGVYRDFCRLRVVSPVLSFHHIYSTQILISDLDTLTVVLDRFGIRLDTRSPTRVHVMPASSSEKCTWPASTFSLEQATDIARTVLQYSKVLREIGMTLGEDRCYLPWNLPYNADISYELERINAVQSIKDLADCTVTKDQVGIDCGITRHPMWDFSLLTSDIATIQFLLGPYPNSGAEAALWAVFSCLFIQGALMTKGALPTPTMRNTIASYHDFDIFLRQQQDYYSEMVLGNPNSAMKHGFDSTLYELRTRIFGGRVFGKERIQAGPAILRQ